MRLVLLALAALIIVLPPVHGQALCTEGETRPCGSDVGVCSPGVSTCINGTFSGCRGGVEPAIEICSNYADDNCNGFVDECTVQLSPAIGLLLGGILILVFVWIVSRVV
ncbi:MAG: hypothetical protein HY367_03375 [Candidatus Aenigmarchaeota archaeon]|nr:hypothetical protein [Candidatus Aenigmarchaeota archaeon]